MRKVKCIRNVLCHDLLIVPEAKIKDFSEELKLWIADILNLIGLNFGCKADTDAYKNNVYAGIDDIMRIQFKKNECSSQKWLFVSLVFNFIFIIIICLFMYYFISRTNI